MPHTTLGRLCCRFGIGSIAAFAAFFGLVAAGQRGGEAGLAVAGAATGIGAMVRQAERAWTVSMFIIFGLLVAIFAAGEVIFPH